MINQKYITYSILFLILLVTTIVAWPALSGPLVFDDFPNLKPLMSADIDSYYSVIFGNQSGVLGRSVSMASFALNHWLSGELIVFDLKLSNLIIHLINGVLLYSLLLILLKRYYSKNYITLALLITALWLINPVNLGTTFYVIQRMALLSCLFVLLGCLLYLKARLTELTLWRYALYSSVLVCFILASLSKENGLLLPFFLFLIELCYFNKITRQLAVLNIQKVFTLLAIVLISGLSILYILLDLNWLNYASRGFTLSERLYTQPVAIFDYILHTFIPTKTISGVYFDDFIVRKVFWNAATLVNTALILLMLITCYFCLIKQQLNQYRLIAFGMLFFLVAHSIESTVLPLEIYFPHRNYLPSIGASLVIVLLIWTLLDKIMHYRMINIISIIYLTFLSFNSWQAAKIWSSSVSITVNAFTQQPRSVRANLSMTQLLVDNGRYKDSLAANGQIIKLRPKMALNSYIQRFYIYCKFNQAVPAEEIELFPKHIYFQNYRELSTALANLLATYQEQQCTAIDIKKIALALADEVDRAVASGESSTSLLWSIEYYIVVFLRLEGEELDANIRLQKSYEGGNQKAFYMMEDLKSSVK